MTSRAVRSTLTSPRTTLIDRLVPARVATPNEAAAPAGAALRTVLLVGAGVVFLALLAQLRVQIGPVPLTGQTLGVLLLGAAYGGRLGALTTGAYALLGLLAQRGWDKTYVRAACAMLLGTVVIYLFGVSWLTVALGGDLSAALAAGLAPFVIGDLIKLGVAVSLLPTAWRLLGRR